MKGKRILFYNLQLSNLELLAIRDLIGNTSHSERVKMGLIPERSELLGKIYAEIDSLIMKGEINMDQSEQE